MRSVRKGARRASTALSLNFFGMKLLIDPAVDAHGRNLLDITGARAEGETVECLYGAFLFG